jgi:hypothetical protein
MVVLRVDDLVADFDAIPYINQRFVIHRDFITSNDIISYSG